MARFLLNLHSRFAVLVLASGLGLSCVVPAAIEGPQEARPNIVLSLTSPDPRQVLTVRQSGSGEVVVSSFNVAVIDPDQQTLRARAFVDGRYDQPLPDLFPSLPPSPDDPEGARAGVFRVRGLCDEKVDFELGAHTLELYVSDEGFVESGSDLRLPQPGGLRDSVLWRFTCAPPLADLEP